MEKYGIRVLDVMPLFVQTAMVNNMDAGTIQNMGIDLTPNDIAQQVLTLVEKRLILDAYPHSSGYKNQTALSALNVEPTISKSTNQYLFI